MALYSQSELRPTYDARKPSPWKVPSLKPEGRPFEPTGLEVGAMVTWREFVPVRSLSGIPTGAQETLERSGQVWSLGPHNSTRWVVTPERESVLLRADRLGRLTRER